MTSTDELDPGLNAVSALADPVRRAAYRAVAAAGAAPVGRDDVAAVLGVGRTLAAFHLDKLVDAGLLEVSYARRSGRSGPGAGRPAKLYRRVDAEHVVSVPPRAYRAAAELLAEAVERAGLDDMLFQVARERGAARATAAGSKADVLELLAEQGYEPVRDGAVVRLRNCPFHQLARAFQPLVCGMNLALLEGVLAGAGDETSVARLDPLPGYCCVSIESSDDDGC